MISGGYMFPVSLLQNGTLPTNFLPADLTPGQVLKAKVVSIDPPGQAQLLLDGSKITVKTDLLLTPDTRLSLEVVQTRDGVSLRPVGPVPESGPLSLPSPGTRTPPGSGLGNIPVRYFSLMIESLSGLGTARETPLVDILSALALKSDCPDRDILPRLMENMGLFMERKLAAELSLQDAAAAGPKGGAAALKADTASFMAELVTRDLKAAVLHMLASTPDGSRSESLKGLAATLDNFSQMNSQAGDTGRFIIPFPVLDQGRFDFGQLLVDTGQKGGTAQGPAERVIRISFLMHMSALGGVRADFAVLDKALTGRFLLEDKATCDYIQGLIPALKKQLLSVNICASKIDCQVARPRSLDADALMRSFARECSSPRTGARGLDLVI